MSGEKLIEILKKMYHLHNQMIDLADEKTDIVKNGDMERLSIISKKEQVNIAAMQALENKRMQETKAFLQRGDTEGTISECIDVATLEVKQNLIHLQHDIAEKVKVLREKNELNQQLLFLSLQFVNETLKIIKPGPKSISYGNQNRQQTKPALSMFDSQA